MLNLKCMNKDGRLIRLDHVLAKARLAARSNIISLIKRLAVYSFFLDSHGPAVTSSAIMLTASTRLPLVSEGRRPTMLVLRRAVSGDAQVKPSFGVGSSV